MRPFELLLTTASALFVLRITSISRPPGSSGLLQLILVLLLLLQIVSEGWRWQLFPVYGVAVLAVAISQFAPPVHSQIGFWIAAAAVAVLSTSVVLCLVLPYVGQQPVTGRFAVGVSELPGGLLKRPSFSTADERSAAPRVRVWYPAEHRSRWDRLAGLLQVRLAQQFRALPDEGAQIDGPLARTAGRMPVIAYFGGWPEDEVQNVSLIRELASRGFFIATLQYPATALLARPMLDYSSDEAFRRTVQLNHARVRAHAQDAVALLDALSGFDRDPANRFGQHLNTARSGLLGFSFGGAVASEASRLDARFQAVVNMDGRHWGEALDHGVAQPFMFICEQLQMPTAAELSSADPFTRYEARLDQVDYLQLAAHLQERGGVRVNITGTAHMNFTDAALRSPLRRFSDGGTIDARRAQLIIRTYILEFFARYLTLAQPPPLDAPMPQFPEVSVQAWRAPVTARP